MKEIKNLSWKIGGVLLFLAFVLIFGGALINVFAPRPKELGYAMGSIGIICMFISPVFLHKER